MSTRQDVLVLGGGLAGLTLALQLRRAIPEARISVVEARNGPAPVATHKVGESTVEIGAHYLGDVLGLDDHLRTQHLRKFGFRFFSSDGQHDITGVQEIGVSRHLNVTSFQIDRGILENHLVEHASALGIEVHLGSRVQAIRLGADGHDVDVRGPDGLQTQRARWVVDASGRAGLLKRQLGLEETNEHDVNAAWFRVKARIDPESWSADERWLGRCIPGHRWLSTNHLVGDGYWVWLIPLSSGYHSIGIVADAATHPAGTMNSYPRALAWLDEHQPRLATALRSVGERPEDFAFLRHFSHDCKQLFSGDRWAITGEAGLFLDPFYSPGTDFIAIANTYITDLVARDLSGTPFAPYASLYDELFHSFARSTMSLFLGQYGIFANPTVLATKVIWDYTFYWGILCQLFFQRKLTDVRLLGRVRGDLQTAQRLNDAAQPFLRRWSSVAGAENPACMLDQARLPWFSDLNASLKDRLDDEQFVARISASRTCMQNLASEIIARAAEQVAGLRDWPESRALLDSAGLEPNAEGGLLRYPMIA
jgi:flavin-dependent dehydrogenase